jgi:hypothetical protein
MVLAGLAVALLVSAGTPILGGQDAAAKRGKGRAHHSREVTQEKKLKGPKLLTDVAIEDIEIAPHADAGHRTVVVTVSNEGAKAVAGFTIGMRAQPQDGRLRNEVFSSSLSLANGDSTTVEFRRGCNWINNGTIFTRTDPNPVPGELPVYSDNNELQRASVGAASSTGPRHPSARSVSGPAEPSYPEGVSQSRQRKHLAEMLLHYSPGCR